MPTDEEGRGHRHRRAVTYDSWIHIGLYSKRWTQHEVVREPFIPSGKLVDFVSPEGARPGSQKT